MLAITHHAQAATRPARFPRPWRLVWHWLALCAARHSSRQDLRGLCPRLRRDLGLTEAMVAREATKPCWRP